MQFNMLKGQVVRYPGAKMGALGLNDNIYTTLCFKQSLIQFRDSNDQFQGHDVSFTYMLRRASYKQGDMIHVTTLPIQDGDLYLSEGGLNSDLVMENTANHMHPFHIDLRDICFDTKNKYFKNRLLLHFINMGLTYLAGFPFLDPQGLGYGVLTVYDNRPSYDVDCSAISSACQNFHMQMKALNQYQNYFGLTDKECLALNHMSSGCIAEDIAIKEKVGRRTIELRLENARTKLRARTTTEAVFKAASYGIVKSC